MSSSASNLVRQPGRLRWVICALLFAAVTINYLDRLVFSILAPELQKIFGWSNTDYTNITFWFEVAYGIGLSGLGWVLGRLGPKKGLSLALAGWSLALMLHAAMRTLAGFSFARFALGLTEAGVFPGVVKIVAE